MSMQGKETLRDHLLAAYAGAMREFCMYPRIREYISAVLPAGQSHILALGKSAAGMARSFLDAGVVAPVDGFVLTKHGGDSDCPPGLELLYGGHPVPDEDSIQASRRIIEWMISLPPQDDLYVLLSGGGSALFEVPRPGVTLDYLRQFNQSLLRQGMSIREMNLHRREVSLLKAGGALRYASCHNIHVLALSDVQDNDPEVICSGPFTPSMGWENHEGVWRKETDDQTLSYRIIGDNTAFRELLSRQLGLIGWHCRIHTPYLSMNADAFPEYLESLLCSEILRSDTSSSPFALIMGGEMPVAVTGNGKGGRCSHLALACAALINRYPRRALFCVATDGNDNLLDSAGGWCDSYTLAKLQSLGIDHAKAVLNADSYTALNQAGYGITPSGVHSNVNDIIVLVAI